MFGFFYRLLIRNFAGEDEPEAYLTYAEDICDLRKPQMPQTKSISFTCLGYCRCLMRYFAGENRPEEYITYAEDLFDPRNIAVNADRKPKLVVEKTHPRKCHYHVVFIAGGDYIIVTYGTTGLGNVGYAASFCTLYVITEGEERIGTERNACYS